eukprot:CAMPEP_0175038876 /NCGR_PEP_ID=MMETSP0052_2-20121109/161_1 /TAXON_ID=51329 ORGANISM="Polytomella parva, Strain SAG 63-3" /NCGR_SAMPLE_ID=MMETSP0052_2 /ASSEMBLY_ACC=CAM_ASM_000194 /LENGTH=500 /DNA_ID=CAMNT_0016300445 /DNA_START=166 /DNA_END=1665 /DNA_ORIENTATION=-
MNVDSSSQQSLPFVLEFAIAKLVHWSFLPADVLLAKLHSVFSDFFFNGEEVRAIVHGYPALDCLVVQQLPLNDLNGKGKFHTSYVVSVRQGPNAGFKFVVRGSDLSRDPSIQDLLSQSALLQWILKSAVYRHVGLSNLQYIWCCRPEIVDRFALSSTPPPELASILISNQANVNQGISSTNVESSANGSEDKVLTTEKEASTLVDLDGVNEREVGQGVGKVEGIDGTDEGKKTEERLRSGESERVSSIEKGIVQSGDDIVVLERNEIEETVKRKREQAMLTDKLDDGESKSVESSVLDIASNEASRSANFLVRKCEDNNTAVGSSSPSCSNNHRIDGNNDDSNSNTKYPVSSFYPHLLSPCPPSFASSLNGPATYPPFPTLPLPTNPNLAAVGMNASFARGEGDMAARGANRMDQMNRMDPVDPPVIAPMVTRVPSNPFFSLNGRSGISNPRNPGPPAASYPGSEEADRNLLLSFMSPEFIMAWRSSTPSFASSSSSSSS